MRVTGTSLYLFTSGDTEIVLGVTCTSLLGKMRGRNREMRKLNAVNAVNEKWAVENEEWSDRKPNGKPVVENVPKWVGLHYKWLNG